MSQATSAFGQAENNRFSPNQNPHATSTHHNPQKGLQGKASQQNQPDPRRKDIQPVVHRWGKQEETVAEMQDASYCCCAWGIRK